MKKMQCENCGGHINKSTMRCEYCGTQYTKDEHENVVRIETFTNPIRVYKAQTAMHSDVVRSNPKMASEYAVKELARNLADAIAENMEVETEYDPRLMMHRMTAKVRIVEPKYVF